MPVRVAVEEIHARVVVISGESQPQGVSGLGAIHEMPRRSGRLHAREFGEADHDRPSMVEGGSCTTTW
jgi:hypothetical protein